ncbi:MAG: SGNH/GDSL hydrolase family protein [Phototrophicaceae bacterium]
MGIYATNYLSCLEWFAGSISLIERGDDLIKQKTWYANLGLIVGGTLFGLVIALIGFRVFIGDFRLILPYIYDDAVVFRSGNGDILFWQSEFIQPLENPEEILSVHRLQGDENGFRLPARPSDTYRVVALGDSYTEGANVARPWSDEFAAASGLATQNLGFRGYGMTHYTWAWEQYGIQEDPDVVIIGFFGGNDVFTAGLGEEPPFDPPNLGSGDELDLEIVTDYTENDEDLRIYPIYTENGTPITFLSTYIGWMNAAPDQLEGSVNYQVIADNLRQIRDTASDDTCLVFAYFPSKPEVYFPYLNQDDYPDLIAGQRTVLINSDGTLHIVEDFTITLNRVMEWRLNTGIVMTELADSLGYEAINLHTTFDERAANGEMLYYTYDTHWNQAGQTLAGETIADFVEAQCTNLE